MTRLLTNCLAGRAPRSCEWAEGAEEAEWGSGGGTDAAHGGKRAQRAVRWDGCSSGGGGGFWLTFATCETAAHGAAPLSHISPTSPRRTSGNAEEFSSSSTSSSFLNKETPQLQMERMDAPRLLFLLLLYGYLPKVSHLNPREARSGFVFEWFKIELSETVGRENPTVLKLG